MGVFVFIFYLKTILILTSTAWAARIVATKAAAMKELFRVNPA